MNILTDQLPTAVMIDETEYPIETDFRTCLRVIMAFEDTELTNEEKGLILLENMYTAPWPDNLLGAVKQAVKFLNGGEESKDEDQGKTQRLYSFTKDANLIFAAYKQTHNIDLADTEYLHWWKFLAMFMDLGSNTTFSNLVSLRKRIKSGKATKEERAIASELGDLIDVPDYDDRTIEEKEQYNKFMQLVEEGKRNRGKEKKTSDQS
jgi:hypothetical protein